MKRLFGTDGVRGVANRELTPSLALKLGMATALLMKKESSGKPIFLIGRDTRISGDMLESALSAGIASTGADVLLAGVIPTAAVAYLVKSLKLTGGAVISASHNLAMDNGIKFFSSSGFKLPDEVEDSIERAIDGVESSPELPVGKDIGRIKIMYDARKRYEDYILNSCGLDLVGYRLAIDCANGSAYKSAPNIFSKMGAMIITIAAQPNGNNINENCGSTHPELLQGIMKTGKFDAGFAFDGDADRLIAVDEKGEIVDGDMILNILARDFAQEGKLPGSTIVSTVMSNMGLEKALSELNIRLVRSDVGDKYVLEEMIRQGAVLGGEQSGHIIALVHNTTGDGLITACLLLKAMKNSGKSLSELRKMMSVYPQVMKNVEAKNKHEILKNENFVSYIENLKKETAGEYRILVRPSGTEPKIRVMVEGPNLASAERMVNEICARLSENDL